MSTPKKDLPKGLRAEDMSGDVADAPMERGTLSGDVRDVLLMHMRGMKVPWSMLNEDEQREKIEAISSCAFDLVRRVTNEIARGGFPSVVVSVGAVKFDKGVEIKLAAPGTVEAITRLAEHGKASAVLFLAEASDYFGERSAAKPDKDQKPLPLSDDES